MPGCPLHGSSNGSAPSKDDIYIPNFSGRYPSEWTPAAEETFESAHEDYQKLRDNTPFPWSDAYGGFWAATKYDDVVEVSQDPNFITSLQNVVPHVPRLNRRPPLHYDPPEHSDYRNAIDRTLRRSSLARREGKFVEFADSLVASMVEVGTNVDAVSDFAAPLAIGCFAEFLGVDRDLAEDVREIGVKYGFAIQDMDREAIAEYSDRLYEIAETVYRDRLSENPDPNLDLVASLYAASQDPDSSVTETTAIATVRQLIVAGMAAPQAVLGSAITHLARDTDLQAHLRSNPDDIPVAVEEFLRLYSPYRVFARTPIKKTTIRGRTIQPDEPVALIYPSANRDESVFPDPHTFILRRPNNKHLAFGRGPHRCPAGALGRLEVVIGLRSLLGNTLRFELSGDVTMMNWLEYGPRKVPLNIR